MLKTIFTLSALLFALNTAGAHASDDITLSELSWIEQKYFDKKRQLVDDIGRESFGTRLRQNKMDIGLLQRILDNQKVTIYEIEKHRAIGVVLGDIYVAEEGWEWREYKDEQGRSNGVCLPKTKHCVFPVSMFTRRLRVTTELNIEKIYQKGLDLMADVGPKLPYSVPIEPENPKKDYDKKRTIIIPYL